MVSWKGGVLAKRLPTTDFPTQEKFIYSQLGFLPSPVCYPWLFPCSWAPFLFCNATFPFKHGRRGYVFIIYRSSLPFFFSLLSPLPSIYLSRSSSQTLPVPLSLLRYYIPAQWIYTIFVASRLCPFFSSLHIYISYCTSWCRVMPNNQNLHSNLQKHIIYLLSKAQLIFILLSSPFPFPSARKTLLYI